MFIDRDLLFMVAGLNAAASLLGLSNNKQTHSVAAVPLDRVHSCPNVDRVQSKPNSTVVRLCVFSSGAPCLSFDIVRDRNGDGREQFPLSMLLCAGTQADTAMSNRSVEQVM